MVERISKGFALALFVVGASYAPILTASQASVGDTGKAVLFACIGAVAMAAALLVVEDRFSRRPFGPAAYTIMTLGAFSVFNACLTRIVLATHMPGNAALAFLIITVVSSCVALVVLCVHVWGHPQPAPEHDGNAAVPDAAQ